MDLLLNQVGPRVQTMMNLVTSIISTVIVLIITCFSLRVMTDFYRTGLLTPSVLEPPKWVLLIPIFVGSLLLFIQFVRRTLSFIDRWKRLGRKESGRSVSTGPAGKGVD
jgi:TRAP-type C4-dicarboxylate transport system permease small subunit